MNKIGFILSGALVVDELKIYFGSISPSQLPLKNKHVYFFQHKFLKSQKCEKVVLLLPNGVNPNFDVDEFMHVNPESSILDIFNVILEKGKGFEFFEILYGDTLIELNPNNDQNTITYGIPKFNYSWGLKVGDKVPVGHFKFSRKYFESVLNKCNTLDDFFSQIKSDEFVKYIQPLKWYDLGHVASFFNSKKEFLESRAFNNLKVRNNSLVKESEDYFKIYAEYQWLTMMKKIIPENIPFTWDFRLYGEKASYNVEYFNLPSLSEMFVFGNLELDYEIEVLKKVIKKLVVIHNSSIRKTQKCNFILNKIKEREKYINKLFPDLKPLITSCKKFFENKKFETGNIHGDFCYSNILFNPISDQFIFLDPRGYLDKKNGSQVNGPLNYDYYKLAHSFICGYDKLISNSKIKLHVFEIKKRFEIFLDLKNISHDELKFGLMQLFITMIPLHYNKFERQKAFKDMAYTIHEEI